jgi:hypothetical protein
LAGCSSQSNQGQGIDQINTPTTVAVHTNPNVLRLMTECTYAGCAAVTSKVAAAIRVKALPPNVHPPLAKAKDDEQLPPGLDASCVTKGRAKSPACLVPGPNGSTRRVALFGDSQAEIWSGTLASIAHNAGDSFLLMAEEACPSPMITFFDGPSRAPDHICDQWRSDAISRINTFNPQVVVIATLDVQLFDSDQALVTQARFGAGLLATIHKVSAPGREIVVIGNTPYDPNFGPACLALHSSDIQKCSAPAKQAVLVDSDTTLQRAATSAGGKYINVVPWFCTAVSCPQVINNTVVYRDSKHFTATYAEQLTTVMTTALGLK